MSYAFAVRLGDVVASARVGSRDVKCLVERAEGNELLIRAPETIYGPDADVRISVKVRRAVNDAMREFDIRIMGTVRDRQPTPDGVRYAIKTRLVSPNLGLRLIAEELARA